LAALSLCLKNAQNPANLSRSTLPAPPSPRDFPVIVIGASMGGMEALKVLFSGLSPELNAALLVVWHMSPESPALLPDILQRVTSLPVASAQDGAPLQPGRASIACPDQHLVLEQNETERSEVIRLTHGPRENRFRPSIDVLFRSAAVACGSRVIGVVLTGALDDGASGLYAIKQCGGTAIVQDPLDAEYPNMPINAMRAVRVDYTAPIAQMSELLSRLVQAPRANRTSGDGSQSVSEQSQKFQTEVRVAMEDKGLESGITALGEISPYTCPECHGCLLQIEEEGMLRFRCHTGHAYTLDALLSELTQSVENALWNALRALQEIEMMTRHLEKHINETGQEAAAEAFRRKLLHVTHQADLVRQATFQNRVPGLEIVPN
jgi:two-component system chemotaxis response regulator CheB